MNSLTLSPTQIFGDARQASRAGDFAQALRLVRQVDTTSCTLTESQLWFVELIEFEQAIVGTERDRWPDHFRRLADTAQASGDREILETALIAEIMMHVHSNRPMRALAAISTLCGDNETLDCHARHELNIHYGIAVLRLGYVDIARGHFEYLAEQFDPAEDSYLWGRALEGLGRCMNLAGEPVEPVIQRLDQAGADTGLVVLGALAGSLKLMAGLAVDSPTEADELARQTADLWRELGHEHRADLCEKSISRSTDTDESSTNKVWASGSEAVAPVRLNPPDSGLLAAATSLRMEDHPSLGGRGIESQFVGSAMARTLLMPTTFTSVNTTDAHPASADRLTGRIQDRPRPQPLTDVIATIAQVSNDRNTGSSDTAIEFDYDSIAVSPLVPVATRMFRSIIEWVIEAVEINSGESPIAVRVQTEAKGSDAVVITVEQAGQEPTTPTKMQFYDRLHTAAKAAELVGGSIDLSDDWAIRVAFTAASQPRPSAGTEDLVIDPDRSDTAQHRVQP